MASAPLPPFSEPRYRISPSIELSVLAPFEAAQVGVILASMEPWSRYPISAADLTAFFRQVEPGAPRYGIRIDGQLEGAIAVRVNWMAGPYIQTLALGPMAQGRRAGSQIMAFVEREARRAGSRNLWVAASDFNAGAIRFYERHGFARIADIDGLLRNDRTEVLLRKKLFATPPPRP